MNARLKAVIFDVDGTLLDSVDLHAKSWVESFDRFGVDAKFEDRSCPFLQVAFLHPHSFRGEAISCLA